MIKVENISKSYGKKKQNFLAVDNISFSVEKGEIFGLIGPDGSGKSPPFPESFFALWYQLPGLHQKFQHE